MFGRLIVIVAALIVGVVTINSTSNGFTKIIGVNGNIKVDGGLISGVTADGVTSFKGVPFAAPPVGDLRWKAPQPVIAWQGVLPANTFGAECPQAPYAAGSIYASPPQKQKIG